MQPNNNRNICHFLVLISIAEISWYKSNLVTFGYNLLGSVSMNEILTDKYIIFAFYYNGNQIFSFRGKN